VPIIKSRFQRIQPNPEASKLKNFLNTVKVVNLVRYLNFVVFNLVVVEGCFYASRIMIHLSKLYDPETQNLV